MEDFPSLHPFSPEDMTSFTVEDIISMHEYTMEDVNSMVHLPFAGDESVVFPEDWVSHLQLLDLQLTSPLSNEGDNTSPDQPSPSISTPPPFDPLPMQEEQHSPPGPFRHHPSTPPQDFPYDSPTPHHIPSTTSAVTLTRDQILSFSSEEFDKFVEKTSSTRQLTSAERREVNKQKRLIKNRESAQQSRKRKKSLIDTLEGEVSELEKINKTVTSQLKDLEADNVILKAEVAQMFTVIRDSPVLSKLLLDVASLLVLYTISHSKKNLPKLHSLPVVKQLQQIEVA